MLYIDKINDTHIDEVYKIFNNSISPSWSIESIKAELKSGKNISLVCLLDSKPIGFLLSSYVLDECDLTNIAVAENYRSKGIGKMLVEALKERCKEKGISSVTLEVRISNKRAISFYEACGFEKLGLRKDFYQNPKEDALIYKLTLKKEA